MFGLHLFFPSLSHARSSELVIRLATSYNTNDYSDTLDLKKEGKTDYHIGSEQNNVNRIKSRQFI